MSRVILTAIILTGTATATARAGDAEDCANATELLQMEPARAVSACRNRAEQGDAHAEFMLGAMYQFGAGVLQDDVRAARDADPRAAGGR